MGQESSHLIDPDAPPETLSDRTLAAVAQFIKDGGAKHIVVMTGAGISTAAGIPDFRSPKTGLYHNLARLNLPHPEAVFEIDFFRSNPAPFYLLAKELYPGNFSPTVSHVFIALLAKKGLLRMLFTQNIDCLERAAGVPADRIVEAHGSFATQRCIDCRTEFPDDLMHEYIKRGEAPHCILMDCNGLVKPDIVFFGEQLPGTFYSNISVPAAADLVLVMGTSLLVHPFAGLPRRAREGVPRVLFNMERVGDMGTRTDDVLVLGDCDSGIRKLADALGWRDELEAMWRGLVGEKEAERQLSKAQMEDAVEDELEKLIGDVETKLDMSEGTTTKAAATDESDANVGSTQGREQADEGAKDYPSRKQGGPEDGTKEGDKVAGEEELVGDSAARAADVVEGKGEKVGTEEEGQKETQEQGQRPVDKSNPMLNFEPLPLTEEKPVTADSNAKAEDKGGGEEKPVL
ncbi:NAD-dependent deacetylase sirtuin-2 [Hypoxylon crocopeplum]|nr:NAD-dependent deacetylase sirtuin-2 [Hypoxylon crocopeplum]